MLGFSGTQYATRGQPTVPLVGSTHDRHPVCRRVDPGRVGGREMRRRIGIAVQVLLWSILLGAL